MAIDDVQLLGCGPPTPDTLPCLPSQFTCASGYCIDSRAVCDLAQDCGDTSDEASCQKVKVSSLHDFILTKLLLCFRDILKSEFVKMYRIDETTEGVC